MTLRSDVIVVGAGLAGLSCARDLAAARVDVCVLDGRERTGGRVEQQPLADGRLVQLGGDVVGPGATAYARLVGELGLSLEPSFAHLPGEATWVLREGQLVGDDVPWFTEADRRAYKVAEAAFATLAETVDPADPWSHPEAERLDQLSLGDFLRAEGATPAVVRRRELVALAQANESVERTSLLAELRKEIAVGSTSFSSSATWECLRVVEGSATVAQRMAEELGWRIRLGAVVRRIDVAPEGCTVWLTTGERLEADAVVSALPVGPLSQVRLDGVPPARLASLERQHQTRSAHAVFVYPVPYWEQQGQNGTAFFEEDLLAGTRSQQSGVLSASVPPDRVATFDAAATDLVEAQLVAQMSKTFGAAGGDPTQVFVRRWHSDPMAQGVFTAWRPGDVMAVGPLHGTHAPPFYVCGADQWVSGSMEGAVRTGRATAAAVIR